MKIELINCTRKKTGINNVLTFILPYYEVEIWGAYLKKEKHFDNYTLIIHNHKLRTTGERSQNKHINGHCQQIAEETGNDFEVVKMTAKWRAIKRGYPFDETFDGQQFPKSETGINTVEAGHLIDELHMIAAELNIRLKEYE